MNEKELDCLAETRLEKLRILFPENNPNFTHKERFFRRQLEKNPNYIADLEKQEQERRRQSEAYFAETMGENEPDCEAF